MVKCLAQGSQQIRTGNLAVESPWSYTLSHDKSSRWYSACSVPLRTIITQSYTCVDVYLCRDFKGHVENRERIRGQIEFDDGPDVNIGEIDVLEVESDAEREDVEVRSGWNEDDLNTSRRIIQVNRLDFIEMRIGKVQVLFCIHNIRVVVYCGFWEKSILRDFWQ